MRRRGLLTDARPDRDRSLVSFGPRERHIGESAKTQEVSNFKNTVGSLKRMLGRSFNDAEIAEHEKKFINAQLIDIQGSVGVKVCACAPRSLQIDDDAFLPGQLPGRAA